MSIGRIPLEAYFQPHVITRLQLELAIATKLYAHHAKIDPEEAAENVRDAADIKSGISQEEPTP